MFFKFLDKILLLIMWPWYTKTSLILSFILKIPGYYYLFGFPQMCPLLLSIWNLRTLETLPGLLLASSNAITSQVWKNHRLSLGSTLLQWKIARIYIFGSRHSQQFRLQLTQISSGLKVVKFYVHGSGLHGLCTDPIFSKLHLHKVCVICVFLLGTKILHYPENWELITIGSQRRLGFQAHRQTSGRALPSPPRAFISSDPCISGILTKHQLLHPKMIYKSDLNAVNSCIFRSFHFSYYV